MHSLLLSKNNQIHILCIIEPFSNTSMKSTKSLLIKTIEQLKNTLQSSVENLNMTFGFGEFKMRITHSYESFKESHHTLDLNRTLPFSNPFYADIGIFQLIKGIQDQKLLSYFIDTNLREVIAHDKNYNSNLLETLAEYLKCCGSKEETAKKLFIHRQTLYRRLEKLKELLGEDFLKPEKRLCLEVALYVYFSIPTSDAADMNV
ncbi:helix-turn-helix domain-containing protein [Niallia sp. 03133]|uniref:helix-turn-helix domain-containing protein n=1 Tax=Niallia sp. 03133 TaxID=3458060 RepID=UPI004044DE71